MGLHLTLLSGGYSARKTPGRSCWVLRLGDGEGPPEGNPSPQNQALAQLHLLCQRRCSVSPDGPSPSALIPVPNNGQGPPVPVWPQAPGRGEAGLKGAVIRSEAASAEHNILDEGVLSIEVLAPEHLPCYLSRSFAF